MSTDPGLERAKKLFKKPLSDNMLNDEKYRVYEPYGFFPDANRLPVLALTRCQGYIFNQDLFATPYQQLRSRALEQKTRTFSYSREAKSRSSLMSSTLRSFVKQRRHTSYDPRPRVGSIFADELDIMDIDDGEVMEDDDDIEDAGEEQESRLEEGDEDGEMEDVDGNEGDLDEDEDEDEEDEDGEDDDDEDGEDDDYSMHFGGYGGYLQLNAYKVKLVEIVVDPNDTSYLPSETPDK